jgi:sec-independent protein translocase protein TatA
MGETSPWHWLVVIAVAVLVFGARRLPDAARSLGRSARILRAELHDAPPDDDPPEGTPAPEPRSDLASEGTAGHSRPADRPAGTGRDPDPFVAEHDRTRMPY